MSDSSLDFNAASLQNSSVEVARQLDTVKDIFLPSLSIVLFVLIVGFSVQWVRKRARENKNNFYKLKNAPDLLKIALIPLLLAFAATHVFSAFSVYYNSKVINSSTLIYFQNLGVGRLFALSHAHFFAHACMYFIMATLVQMSEGCLWSMIVAPLLALWAGVFDVVSWWGVKTLSPHFEYLSILTGISFSLSFILMSYEILKSAFSQK
jgi:hypothetical protein